MATFESTIYMKIWCSPCTVPRSSRAAPLRCPRRTITACYRTRPSQRCVAARPTATFTASRCLRTPPCRHFPHVWPFFLSTAAPAGMLSAHSHDHRSVLSRSLSGGKLPLEYSNISAAAAAAAAARWAAARLARATTVDDVDGRGRIEVATPATVAAVRAAEAPRAGAGAAVACGAAAPVAGGGALGSLRARAVDFYVCVGRAACARGS